MEHTEELRDLAIGLLVPSEMNPRIINEASERFKDLTESIQESGVYERIIVRPHPEQSGRFEILSGERRTRASTAAGLKTVPAIVREGITDAEAMEIVFFGNFAREDLTALEESKAVRIWMEKLGGEVKAVAAKLGWTEKAVRLRIQMENLIEPFREKAEQDLPEWTAAHWGVVAKYPQETQERIYKDNRLAYHFRRGESIAELDAALKDYQLELDGAIFDPLDEKLTRAGACYACPKRSSFTPTLFDQDLPEVRGESIPKGDRCLDRGCWKKKHDAHLRQKAKELKKDHPDLVKITSIRGGKDTYASWEFDKAKKTDPGAIPAMVTEGARAGTVTYIKPRKSAQAARERAEKKKEPENAPVKTLEQLRDALDDDRIEWMIDQVAQSLECARDGKKGPLTISRPDVKTILAIYICVNESNWCEAIHGKLRALLALSDDAMHKRLWEYSINAISDALNSPASENLFPIAEALGIDAKELEARAAKELPEPTEWQHLNEDGTRKDSVADQAKATAKKGTKKKPAKKAKKGGDK